MVKHYRAYKGSVAISPELYLYSILTHLCSAFVYFDVNIVTSVTCTWHYLCLLSDFQLFLCPFILAVALINNT